MPQNSLRYEDAILELPITDWQKGEADGQSAVSSLEQGIVLYLPQLAFTLTPEEKALMHEDLVEKTRKNITYHSDIDKLEGVAEEKNVEIIHELMQRYHQACQSLLQGLIPQYMQVLSKPMNTLRVHPVKAWKEGNSWKKDDTRLHVDAFPSRPIQGKRILRIFTNINPNNEPRVWKVGEPFAKLTEQFLPRVKPFHPFISWLQQKLKITKSYRSEYDHIMLGMHDAMKFDTNYQEKGKQLEVQFPTGTTWICFSDDTAHAAMSGQFMLEQTFLIPAEKTVNPEYSPLKILEKKLNRKLA